MNAKFEKLLPSGRWLLPLAGSLALFAALGCAKDKSNTSPGSATAAGEVAAGKGQATHASAATQLVTLGLTGMT